MTLASQVPVNDWPKYKSSKVVSAVKVISYKAEGGMMVLENGHYTLTCQGPSGPFEILVPRNVFHRYAAEPGDWLVSYEDGYLSVSPALAFDNGYSAI